MRTLLNLIWFFISGFWLALGYALAGVIMYVFVVTIPFGIASFRIARYVLWPFGYTTVPRPDAGIASTVGNVLWFVFAGLWIAISHIGAGAALCVTIIGIPFGIKHFSLAMVALAPLGKEIVDRNDPRATWLF